MCETCDRAGGSTRLRHPVLCGHSNHVPDYQKDVRVCRPASVRQRNSVQNFSGFDNFHDRWARSKPWIAVEPNRISLQHSFSFGASTANRVYDPYLRGRRRWLVCVLQKLDNSVDLAVRILNRRLRKLIKYNQNLFEVALTVKGFLRILSNVSL